MKENIIINVELETIATEIIALKNQTAEKMILMGQKFIEAKKLIPHGEWGTWLESKIGFSQRTANQFMKIAKEYTSNSQAITNLDATKIYLLLELPVEERENFIQQHDLKNISTRDMKKKLQEYKHDNQEIWNVVDRVVDDNIYEIQIDELKPFPNHEHYFWEMRGKNYIEFLSSVEENGVLFPIIITRDKVIISGHQRVRACKDLGMDTIPAYYFFSENKQNRKLDELLLSAFIACNMHTRTPVFWLACAWNSIYFGEPEKYDYYIKRFIEDDTDTEMDTWIEEARTKLTEQKENKI